MDIEQRCQSLDRVANQDGWESTGHIISVHILLNGPEPHYVGLHTLKSGLLNQKVFPETCSHRFRARLRLCRPYGAELTLTTSHGDIDPVSMNVSAHSGDGAHGWERAANIAELRTGKFQIPTRNNGAWGTLVCAMICVLRTYGLFVS